MLARPLSLLSPLAVAGVLMVGGALMASAAHAAAPRPAPQVIVVADDPEAAKPLLAELTKALRSVRTTPVRLLPTSDLSTTTGATGVSAKAKAILAIGPRAAKAMRSSDTAVPRVVLGLVTVGGQPAPVAGVSTGWARSMADGSVFLANFGATEPVFVADASAVERSATDPVTIRRIGPKEQLQRRAVILGPLADRQSVANKLTAAGALVYDTAGPALVRGGVVLAGASSDDDVSAQARWAAIQLGRILDGRKPDPVGDLRPEAGRSAINLGVAVRLAATVPWQAMAQARVFARTKPSNSALSLTTAVKSGLASSLAVRSSKLNITVANADVRSALSRLLPQLSMSLSGQTIDTDTARAGNGMRPQYTMDFQTTVTQLLYSEQAWLGLATSKLVHRATKQGHETTLLDVALQVSQAWLGAQQASAVVGVQRQLLEVSRENRTLALGRVRAGRGTKADVLRWDSQIAMDTASLMDAVLNANTARLGLALAMGLPPGKRLELAQPSSDDLAGETGAALIAATRNDIVASRRLEADLVHQALATDPELQRLKSLRGAQEQVVAHTTRSLFIPTIGLSAGLSHRLVSEGLGTPPDLPTSPDDTSLFVGFNVSLPLFSGGARYATLDKARAETSRIQTALAARRLAVDKNLRQAFRSMRVAFAKVSLHDKASAAAKESFAMVTRAYGRGAIGIAPVLDAQAQLQRTELASTAARFGAQNALVQVYRQLNAFYFLMSPAEQTQWQSSLNRSLLTNKP